MPFVCQKLINWIIVSSGIWSSLVIYSAISHYHFLYILLVVIFSASCVCPDILSIIRQSTLPVQKCNNVRDLYELPDFCPLNSPDLGTFIFFKYGAARLPGKAQDVDDLMQNLIDARVGVEQSVIDDGSNGADVSMSALEPQEDILNIHRDID